MSRRDSPLLGLRAAAFIITAAALLMNGAVPAYATLVTTLVGTDSLVGGLFRYHYLLTNEATSDEDVNLFQLDVATNANLQALSNTLGWDVTYAPGSPNVIWTANLPPPNFTPNNLQPGASGDFTFESALAPGEHHPRVGNNQSHPCYDADTVG